MKPKICPVCEQDYIYKYVIQEANIIIFVCDECDCTWLDSGNINFHNALDFSEVMIKNGIDPNWHDEACISVLCEGDCN